MRVARISSLSLAFVLLLSAAAAGQDLDFEGDEPPTQFPGAKLGSMTNGYADATLNETIDQAVLEANQNIGGRPKIRFIELTPERRVTRAARDTAEDGFDIVVLSGSYWPDAVRAASQFPDAYLIDVAVDVPCVTPDGLPDPSGTCRGGETAIPTNYMAISFAEDEAGYLAGIIAAAASRNGRIGIIGGTPDCRTCNKYMQGFELGARSIKPGIEVAKAFLSDDDREVGFLDGESARLFVEAFVDVYQPDVVFPVAGANTFTMLDAACDRGVRIVGSDLDASRTWPQLADCVLTSAVKPVREEVMQAIYDVSAAVASDEGPGGLRPVKRLDSQSDSIGVTDEWRRIPGLPVDLQTLVDEAYAQMQSGLATTCYADCGGPDPEPGSDPDAVADDGTSEDAAGAGETNEDPPAEGGTVEGTSTEDEEGT